MCFILTIDDDSIKDDIAAMFTFKFLQRDYNFFHDLRKKNNVVLNIYEHSCTTEFHLLFGCFNNNFQTFK